MKKIYPLIILVLLLFSSTNNNATPNIKAFSFFYSDPAGCFASKVVSYSPGKTKRGAELPADKKMPDYALGQPERNNTNNFVSLGFGGSIVLFYYRPIPNLPGTDLYIVETSTDNCSLEKEKAAIYASKDGINWTYIAEGCQDIEIDLPPSLDWVNYFKIVDISNPQDFASDNADGYDLDGLEAIQCLIYPPANKPIIPIVECITQNTDGTYTAKFGYDNRNTFPVPIEVSAGNNFVRNVSQQNQPTLFLNGIVHNAFSAPITASDIVWEVKGPDGILRSATANASSTNCIAATIKGNQTICSGESATLYVELEGAAPWNIIYKDQDNNQISVTNILTTPYSFTTSKASTYTLVEVTDFSGSLGNVYGSAKINIKAKPSAILTGNGLICGVANTTLLNVNLTGQAPFNFIYTDGSTNHNVVTGSDTYSINASVGKTYSLVSLSDAFCSGSVSGSIAITQKTAPTASINGSTSICGEGTAPIKIDLTGTAPWTITYNDGTSDVSLTNIQKTPLVLEGTAGKTYKLLSVIDASCTGSVSGVAVITKHNRPTAMISGGGKACKDGEAPINITFNGEAPFMFVYSDGTTLFTQYDYMLPTISFNGKGGKTYQLVSIKDKNCDGLVSGLAQVELLPPPNATIKGSKYICEQDEKSKVVIELTGTPPFTFTYTDGKTPVTMSGITTPTYSLEVKGEGSYKLISFQDALCNGEVSGKADILMQNLNVKADLAPKYCYGDPIPLNMNVFTGGDILSTEWSTSGKGKISSVNGNPLYTPATDETGEISFTLTVKGKCETKTFSWNTQIQEKLNAGFIVEPSEIYVGNTEKLIPNSNSNDLYAWFILKDKEKNTFSSKELEYIFEEPGEYTIILAIKKGDCYENDTLKVKVKSALPEVYVPNIFNLSALHPESRVVKVYGEEVSNDGFIFRIYNKWGNVLYEVKDFKRANNEGWNGKDTRSGEIQPIGAYTYTLDGKFNNGAKFHKAGTVTLAK